MLSYYFIQYRSLKPYSLSHALLLVQATSLNQPLVPQNVMLNLFQHLIRLRIYETPKQVRGDRNCIFSEITIICSHPKRNFKLLWYCFYIKACEVLFKKFVVCQAGKNVVFYLCLFLANLLLANKLHHASQFLLGICRLLVFDVLQNQKLCVSHTPHYMPTNPKAFL